MLECDNEFSAFGLILVSLGNRQPAREAACTHRRAGRAGQPERLLADAQDIRGPGLGEDHAAVQAQAASKVAGFAHRMAPFTLASLFLLSSCKNLCVCVPVSPTASPDILGETVGGACSLSQQIPCFMPAADHLLTGAQQ